MQEHVDYILPDIFCVFGVQTEIWRQVNALLSVLASVSADFCV